ncbi:N-acetylglucosaminyl-diphospho-decaprenol L-rhamnosyltransferase [termite gut metagenome]|uniref:N-acetylglucosaminyl-diphospho-decaprenol L-rhamnosyltransferase n=1 Tax=termite gut metagenome TaxID=433724 RepID=A0A5J4SI24_9ZZZZ
MRILAIIVSYNFERWLSVCLNSIRESAAPLDVMVIDNHSTDKTVQRIQTEYPEVRLIVNRTNLGFGVANNIGMNIALQEGYDAVFLLNQDAWIDSQTIGTLFQLSRKYPQYGILSPVHLNGKGDALDHGFAVYAGVRTIDELPSGSVPVECAFINAAFWMIPSAVLQTVGGFSPLFWHYGEDKDYINRLKYHGYSVGYSPSVFGFHDRECRTAMSRKMLFHTGKAYLLSEYANINYSFPQALGYGVLAGIQKALQSAAHGKLKDSGKYISIAIDLLRQTPEVRKVRRETRHKKANYIQ